MDSGGARKIMRLEEAVVNRIAAGEVIQRPCNAIKEMIENSLDAGSTSIQVTVKAGGLKMLQIQDNGSGIHKEDLSIVCERFTTSKLAKFEDLAALNTYGFRGEALASISHVAHVTITSRTATSKCAYRACYSDGKLIAGKCNGAAEIRACAGNQGTVILVEDLFYNVNTRRKALKSPADEMVRINDMLTKYAVHNSGISFTLKKHGSTTTEVKTSQGSTIVENIGLLYGSSVHKELLSVSCEDNLLGFKMTGLVTNANYSTKRLCFLLFINNRLVECGPLRKALELVYAAVLPKGSHPFLYMSISVKPDNIDVNVHPTKHEVHFLHEDKLVEMIQKCVEKQLVSCGSSRTYYTQSLLPANLPVHPPTSGSHEPGGCQGDVSKGAESRNPKQYEYNMVRTDARERTLKAFVVPKEVMSTSVLHQSSEHVGSEDAVSETNTPTTLSRRKRQPVHLTSVLSLQKTIKSQSHSDLTQMFAHHKFVGVVDQTRSLIQYETGLYLLDLRHISKELFYQIVIMDFANFGGLKLEPPAPIYDLLMLALQSPASGWCPEDGPQDKLAEHALECLNAKAEMLKEYFSLEIQDGYLLTLPVLLEKYSPNLDRLPHFLLCLAVEVDWNTEKNCFHTLAQQCANFYCIQHDPFLESASSPPNRHTDSGVPMVADGNPGPIESTNSSTEKDLVIEGSTSVSQPFYMKPSAWQWSTEHVLLPAIKHHLLPPCTMATNGCVLQIADLHELYKVFERC